MVLSCLVGGAAPTRHNVGYLVGESDIIYHTLSVCTPLPFAQYICISEKHEGNKKES